MANKTIEHEGLLLVANDLGSEVEFSIQTYDTGGGAGVADSSIDIQGYRVEAHDNGDGTFSPTTIATDGAGPTVEIQGLRFKLRDTGRTITISGVVHTLYAILIFAT